MARNGFSQNIVIRYVHDDDLINLYSRLIETGLAKTGSLTMASAVGCSGTTSCNLALTNSHRLAKEIQRKFLELKLDDDDDLRDSSIKISGCPNSCGQHEIATIDCMVVVLDLAKTCTQIMYYHLEVDLMVNQC